MHGRSALGAVLMAGMIAAPVGAAGVTVGLTTVPALADHGHHQGYQRLRGIITGPISATSLVITPLPRHDRGCLTSPAPVTVTVDPATTSISAPSMPSATTGDIGIGDAVTVTWNVPRGTATTGLPATSVADTGVPAPVRCVVHGIASSAGSTGGVSLTVAVGHDAHRRNRGRTTTLVTTPLTLTFDQHTAFVVPGVSTPDGRSIAQGDRLIVIWTEIPGTSPTMLPAVQKVIDLGPPPNTRIVVRGVATAPGTKDGVTITTVGDRHRRHDAGRRHHTAAATTVTVTFDQHTTFVVPGVTTPDGTSIAQGDRLVLVWTAPEGTPLASLPAVQRVIDLGPAAGV
jgi:hypothetical protein